MRHRIASFICSVLLPFLVSLPFFRHPARGQTGIITTIAGVTPAGGQPVRGYSGDGGPATSAKLALANLNVTCTALPPSPVKDGIFLFDQIVHLSVDSSGNVYFADSDNQRIRRITPDGVIATVAGSGQIPPVDSTCTAVGSDKDVGDGGPATAAKLYEPSAVIAAPDGRLIIADQQDNRIRQVTPDGVISTVVGNGMHNLYAPGVPATDSPMDWPAAVALDPKGVLHFAEIHGHRVAKIGPDGRLVTVAGTGLPGYNGDNQPATSTALFAPSGIAFDQAGNLYIADQSNHRIRKVTPAGIISTIAGNGIPGFSGDGRPAQSVSLLYPEDVTVDNNGNVYIADTGNNRVRRVDPSGIITTVAGDGQPRRGPDGVPAISSSLSEPAGVAVDAQGDLYIVDWLNYLIRKVSFHSPPLVSPGGIVNGASFAPAPFPVAPGSIISIFGVNLAFATASASSIPLPMQLAGTSVSINGIPAPLFFVSPAQINAQLPWEVASGTSTATVTNSAGDSQPVSFNVASSSVGLFQFPGSTRAVALNQDSTLNGPANPEARGNVIAVFLTGQGPVAPAVPTGQAAPLSPLSAAKLAVTATVGGQTADVQFIGLAPLFVGLAQANIQMPTSVTPGDQVGIYLSINGQAGNTATISVK